MKCKYCNADISLAEKICPKCHHSVKEDNPDALRKKKRNRYITIGVSVIAFIFIVSTIGITLQSQQTLTSQTGTSSTAASDKTAGASLDTTYGNLMERFNDNSAAQKEHILLKSIDEKSSSFQYNLLDTLILSGKIDVKNQKLLSVQMIAQPATQDDMVKMVTAIGVLIESFYPSDASAMRKKVLADLGFKQGSDIRTANNVAIQGNTEFHFAFIKDTGYVFIVKNKNAD
jgi:hypothetical protein